MFMLLSKNPQVLQKLRGEHNKLFGDDRSTAAEALTRCPTKLNDLEYTTAVIKETLRIFPVGFALREAPSE
jgi:cytochrome P450